MASQIQIEDLIANPLSILAVKDQQVIDQLNSLIPYSTAFEIECDMVGKQGASWDNSSGIITLHNEIFGQIPDILAVQNDPSEQRYRIPHGIKGIICLYHISEQLKVNSLLNLHSSIHYHVDRTENRGAFLNAAKKKEQWILSELDTWLIEDNATVREGTRIVGSWFKYNDLGTIEFRLGEMTFDYHRILKRVIHANKIAKTIKDIIPNYPTYKPFESINIESILEYRTNLDIESSQNRIKLRNLQIKLQQQRKKLGIEPKKEEQIIFKSRIVKV